ncbi:hypothetical protein ALC53_08043 [Atta colombica]|uniref:Uncharacterized protein n=1 Tax=Atta colombica TaxID=520822 RepID=A0A151I2U4_9HYME|nr:hypothetical protein ALC53_08043 [Atta colombica]
MRISGQGSFNTTTKCFVNISAPSQLVTASYPRANKAILRRRKNDSTDSRLVMERYEEEAEDSDNETDPEQLLNEWLGELDSLTVVSLYFSSRGFFLVVLRSGSTNNCRCTNSV